MPGKGGSTVSPTVMALGRELNTSETTYSTDSKPGQRVVEEQQKRGTLTSLCPWFSSRSQLLPVTQRDSSK